MNLSISIITITRNRAGFISEAIESALEQSFPDWELIVIDDASEDNTREIVEEYIVRDSRIKYFRNDEHLRISKSRNKALSLALGEYVAVLDSDDVWSDRDKLKKQYGFLEGNKDYVLIGGGVIVIDEYGKEIRR
ncbi:MAG: Glycosyl transferase family 2, partial [Microgenomates group bacterium GW2011_GWA2_44_7]